MLCPCLADGLHSGLAVAWGCNPYLSDASDLNVMCNVQCTHAMATLEKPGKRRVPAREPRSENSEQAIWPSGWKRKCKGSQRARRDNIQAEAVYKGLAAKADCGRDTKPNTKKDFGNLEQARWAIELS